MEFSEATHVSVEIYPSNSQQKVDTTMVWLQETYLWIIYQTNNVGIF